MQDSLVMFTPGKSQERNIHSDAAKGAPLKQLKSGITLSALAEDYRFFTYAPLFMYGDLEHNPVQEWINLYNRDQVVFIIQLPVPVIQLNSNSEHKLDSVIWAARREEWPKLASHIGTIALVDHNKKRFTRVICQKIPILDVNTVNNLTDVTTPPSVILHTFSVDCNLYCVVFNPANNLFVDRPTLVKLSPIEETRKFANAIFEYAADPYGDVHENTVTSAT
jgi:hypothetical protein